jgi:serine/threonine-protein kinase
MSEPPPAPEVPGIEVLCLIGSGGMGSVWKARRPDGALAAVKVAEPNARIAAVDVASHFRREAVATLNLDHPNLVRGLDVGTTADGRVYLAMEFVDGPSLARLIREEGPLGEKRVVAIATGVARGLDHAHRLGLLHRDVKPDNVLIAPDGTPKLADLGLVSESADASARAALGTRAYAAPEVLAGGVADARSDLYALGVTLVAAALGAEPRRAKGLAGRRLPAEAGGVALSEGFRAVVERLLRREPKERYASAAELLLDLEALLAGDRPLGAILGRGPAARRRAWRRILPVGVALAALAAVVASFVAGSSGGGTDSPGPSGPAVPGEDPRVTAARLFLERFPEDFVRGGQMLAEADDPALAPADRERLAAVRAGFHDRFSRAAEAAFLDRERRARAAAAAGDPAAAKAILLDWPERLSPSPWRDKAARFADALLAEAGEESDALAAEAEALVAAGEKASAGAGARAVLGRLKATLARAPFEGDGRERLLLARESLSRLVAREEEAAAARTAEASARAAAEEARARDKAAIDRLSAAIASPDPETGVKVALLALAALDASRLAPAAAGRLLAALARAEPQLGDRLAALEGRLWAWPSEGGISVGLVQASLAPRSVWRSPSWGAVGGRVEALEAEAGGPAEAGAWLWVHGLAAEGARVSGDAAVLLAALPAPPSAPPVEPRDLRRVALALRDGGALAAGAPDPVLDAWAAVRAGRAAASPAEDPRAAAAKAEGLDAFLADDLPAAWDLLGKAADLAPRDAEIAALRGRILLAASRALPTAPVLFLAFSEGRRGADLEPGLPAAWSLAAEAGMLLCELAAPPFAERARPLVAEACEEACRSGRDDARFLAFAGEWHLDGNRPEKAVLLLRRAVARAPEDGPLRLLLDRAEAATR